MAAPRLRLSGLQRDSLLLLGAQTFYKVSAILLLVALSRRLSREDIGLFSFATSFAESFAVLASLNLNPVLMRRVAAEPGSLPRHLASLLGFRLASAPVYLAVVCLAAWLTNRGALGVITAVAIYTLLENVYFSFGSLFIAQKRVTFNVAIGVAVQCAFLTAAVWGLWTWPSLDVLLGAGMLRSALLIVIAAAATHRWVAPLRLGWDWGFIREGGPFVLITVVTLMRDKVDTLSLGFLSTYAVVGVYSLAQRVILAPMFLPGAVGAVLFPHLVAGGFSAQNRRRMLLTSGALLAVGVLGAGVTIAAATPVSRALYGPLAGDVAPVLRAMAWLFPIAFLDQFLGACLQALYREKALFRATAVSAVVGVAANLLLIPRYGAYGAVAAQILATLLRLALIGHTFGSLSRDGASASDFAASPT